MEDTQKSEINVLDSKNMSTHSYKAQQHVCLFLENNMNFLLSKRLFHFPYICEWYFSFFVINNSI